MICARASGPHRLINYCLYLNPTSKPFLNLKRWAGHSKWANIKHQKAANDAERQKTFTKISRMIKVAVQEGNSVDPEANHRLQSVIGYAKQMNMPASTITNSIKAASSSRSSEGQMHMLQIRGPGRCVLLLEILTPHPQLIKNSIAAQMKKFGYKYETGSLPEFAEKGYIISAPCKNDENTLEKAVEHAIEAGIEEVTLDEATGKLKFECSPERTFKAKKALESLGYKIDAALIEILPVIKIALTDQEIQNLEKFLSKIEVMPEIVRVIDNVE